MTDLHARDAVWAGGAVGDGVTLNDSVIASLLAAVPPYSGGAGSTVIEFPEGIFQLANSQTIWDANKQGLTFKGAGGHATIFRGNVAGPLFTNDSGTQEVYNRLDGIGLVNTSTNVAARTLQTNNMNELALRDSYFSCAASGSGSAVAQLDSTYDLLVTNCAFEGASADRCLSGTTQNVATYLRNSFRNTKAGIRLATSTAVNLIGNSFQSMTGSPVDGLDSCIRVAGNLDGTVFGNYLESCNTPFFTGTAASVSFGYTIGGNYITNPGGTAAIFLAGMSYSHVLPHAIVPGANAANINAVDMNGSDQCTVYQQRVASGAGVDRVRGTATNWVDHRQAYIEPRNSLVILQKAGIPVDGDFSVTPSNGTLAVDTTNNKLYVRIGAAWKGVLVA